MKFKIFIFICLSSLLLFTICINLKYQRLEKEKLLTYQGFHNLNFREKDFGGLLKSLPNKAIQLKDNIKENIVNKLDEGTRDKIAGTLNKGVDKVGQGINSGMGKLGGKFGIDTSGAQNQVNSTAAKVKKEINCFFGKCPEEKTAINKTDGIDIPKKVNNTVIDDNLKKPDNSSTLLPDNDKNNKKDKKNKKDKEEKKDKPKKDKKDKPKKDKKKKPSDRGNDEITLNKRKIQSQIDPRYILMREQDEYMNTDNTVRFIASDTTDMQSYSLKLYFKGNPSNGEFYSQNKDPTFLGSLNDCKNHKVITNRLYEKPASNNLPIDLKVEKSIYSDINLPQCLSIPDNGNLKTDFLNIFSLPEGIRLDKKCIKEIELNKNNSCFPYLRLISTGVLHAIKLFNIGNVFFKHGNIFPHNIYLLRRNDVKKVFLDNMVFDNNKYDDISQKPFKQDLNMLGDTLIHLLSGTSKSVVPQPIESAFDIYHSIKKYFLKNNLDLNIRSTSLNMASNFKEESGKCVTIAEINHMLKKTIFNFIYRLKCSGKVLSDQFMDVDQALNHEFLKTDKAVLNLSDTWGTIPSDF